MMRTRGRKVPGKAESNPAQVEPATVPTPMTSMMSDAPKSALKNKILWVNLTLLVILTFCMSRKGR